MVMVFIRSTACDVANESQASFCYPNLKRRSVTMLESGGHPDTALTSALL